MNGTTIYGVKVHDSPTPYGYVYTANGTWPVDANGLWEVAVHGDVVSKANTTFTVVEGNLAAS